MIPRYSLHRVADLRGFGLLELLIATAIGVVILAMLLQFAASATY